MAQPNSSSTATLYPQLESTTAPLDESHKYQELVKMEKEYVAYLKDHVLNGNPLEDIADCSILPTELLMDSKKSSKSKMDPLKRLKDLPTEDQEDEEETEDEEEEDEELVEDEEDDAGGDYVVSHFDNGEGYDDNDDEGEDITSVI